VSRLGEAVLRALGIDPRGWAALTRALLLMDLRGQHYARATATRPNSLVSPLFLVVGQCLTLSALASLFLFARVDVFFYTFVGLSLSMVVLASAVLVEFHEVVLDPRDLGVIGHRPLNPHTYAAARFTNLLFYFGLLYLALNLFPLVLGAGLRDAGPWYAPAYLLASLAGNLAVLAVVVLGLSLGGTSRRLEGLKEMLAWTQILLIMVVFYGGQLLLRDGTHAVQTWGAFPPGYVRYLPPAWLANFVEQAAYDLGPRTAWAALLLVGVALASVGVTVGRLAWLYRGMQPAAHSAARRPMRPGRVGGLAGAVAGWLARGREERVGYWMCRTMLRRDVGLAMQCLLAFNLAAALVVVGLLTGQFGNPCREPAAPDALPPVLAVYLIALAVPVVVYNLSYCRDSAAGWVLAGAPLAGPGGVARGACKAVMVWLVSPMCLLFGVTAAVAWGDVGAAALHAGLAWALSWPAALAGLWLVARAAPFTLPPARGAALGLPPLPVAALAAVGCTAAAVHALFAASPLFWVGAGLACVAATWWLGSKADARLARLGGAA
jgi:hypothetical protein